jgi:HME family heavy-metal exporter
MREGMSFGPELIQRGTREHAAPVLMAALVTAAAVLPFMIFGARPGHEALGPLAMVMLGGLVTTTLYTLGVVPALFSRFGGASMTETVSDEDLGISA